MPSTGQRQEHLDIAAAAERVRAAADHPAPSTPAVFSTEHEPALRFLAGRGGALVFPGRGAILVLYEHLEDASKHLDNAYPRDSKLRALLRNPGLVVPYVQAEGAFGWTNPAHTRLMLLEALTEQRPVSVTLALGYLSSLAEAVPVAQLLLTGGWERYGSQLAMLSVKRFVTWLPQVGTARLRVVTDATSFEPTVALGALDESHREQLARALELLLGRPPSPLARSKGTET